MAETKKKPAVKKVNGTGSFKETGIKAKPKTQSAKKPATKTTAKKPVVKKPTQEKVTKVTEVATPSVETSVESKQSLWQKIKNWFL